MPIIYCWPYAMSLSFPAVLGVFITHAYTAGTALRLSFRVCIDGPLEQTSILGSIRKGRLHKYAKCA